MIKLGVTGGIGSGKTLVCSIISAMGYPVYNADLEARRIIDTDSDVILSIKNLFGDDIYADNQLRRKRVSEIVFSDLELLEKLNSIVHPAVAKHFDEWVMLYQSRSIVVQEAAILFESGAYKSVDKIISVIAPTDIRVKRVQMRDGLSQEIILSRIKSQLPQEELIKRSDYIIENDGVNLILPQIIKIINDLVKDI
jgi:dephospho-CoA kinase